MSGTGGHRRIYNHQLDPGQWIADHVATYVQRDVRQIVRVVDLTGQSVVAHLNASGTLRKVGDRWLFEEFVLSAEG